MIGYLDLPSGISGDMFLGCLVDAGWPIEELRSTLTKLRLPAGDWSVEAKTVMKGPLRATLVDVRVTEGDDSMLRPLQGGASLIQPQSQGHGHTHRNLHDIRAIIGAADLPAQVKERASAVFARLAAAEAKVHGTTIEAIHFHEVGALDAIVDIVGSVAGVQALGIEKLYASAVPLGEGWTKSAHGKIPLPAPATLELLAACHAPTRAAPGPGELVTPTGAALLAELATFKQPAMRLDRVALGAGQKDFDWPNMARLWLGTESSTAGDAGEPDRFVEISTNIDDMNPQFYSAVSDRLFAAGALDVWLTPVQMKKGRPGVVLSVLARIEDERVLAELLLMETTTLGVRVRPVHRHEAQRQASEVATAFGTIRVKIKRLGDRIVSAAPEYDDCRAAADAQRLPVRQVYDAAVAAAQTLVGELRSRE